MRFISSLILCLAFCSDLPLLGQTASCNHKDRQLAVAPGMTNPFEQHCANGGGEITVSGGVAGGSITFKTPATCLVNGTHYESAVYTCSTAANSLGNHCKADGYRVHWIVYKATSTSPCPTVPKSWEEAKNMASTVLNCGTVEAGKPQYDWSARVSSCGGSVTPVLNHGDTLANGILVWHLAPEAALSDTSNPYFQSPVDVLENCPATDLPAPLAAAHADMAPLAAYSSLDVTAVREFRDPVTGETRSWEARVVGSATAAGRFRVRETTLDDEDRPLTRYHSFDGKSYFEGLQGADYYSAWSSEAAERNFALQSLAWFMDGINRSLRAPALVVRHDSLRFETSTVTPAHLGRQVLQVESRAAEGSDFDGRARFHLDTIGTDLYRFAGVDLLDASLHLRRRITFSEFDESGTAGVSRPFVIRDQEFDGSGTEVPLFDTRYTFKIIKGTQDAIEIGRIPDPAEPRWFIRP